MPKVPNNKSTQTFPRGDPATSAELRPRSELSPVWALGRGSIGVCSIAMGANFWKWFSYAAEEYMPSIRRI